MAYVLITHGGYWTVYVAGCIGAALARTWVHRRLRRLIQSAQDRPEAIAELATRRDGTVVRMRGVVHPGGWGGVEGDRDCVYESVLERGTITERAVSFLLVDERGESVVVDVSEARLVHVFKADGRVRVGLGHLVEVVGRKERMFDGQMRDRLSRQDPVRTVLRAPHGAPLLIMRLVDRHGLPLVERRAVQLLTNGPR
jgi:hypothetical protein